MKFTKDELYLMKDFLEERLDEYTDDEHVYRDNVESELVRYKDNYKALIKLVDFLIKE
jgi:hypothetical protein